MFTLRRISQSSGVQMNQVLGDSYTLIDRERNYDDFCISFENYFKTKYVPNLDEKSDDDSNRVYAFICTGSLVQPLYKNQGNFIMASNGKTFDNVSFK
jgi:hypothetical protein